LALQGDVREHLRMLTACGADARPVRRPEELAAVEGLVIPGGESTTIGALAVEFGLQEPVRQRIAQGMPVYGSCAGLVLLARQIVVGGRADSSAAGVPADQPGFGGIDMVVRRNAFGRQVDSFETVIDLAGIGQVPAVFIRAPVVERVGPGVTVLGRTAGKIVAVRQDRLLATSFHPELTGDLRVHRMFLEMVRAAAATTEG
jgi:5'-phosphate synthase pdxT subunit